MPKKKVKSNEFMSITGTMIRMDRILKDIDWIAHNFVISEEERQLITNLRNKTESDILTLIGRYTYRHTHGK